MTVRLVPHVTLACVILAASSLWGCVEQANKKLEERLASVEKELTAMREDVGFKLATLESRQERYGRAVLDASSPGGHHQRLDTSEGMFLVSLKDVKPYLDGHKLIFDLGNPSTATYHGFKIELRWGKRFEDVAKKTWRIGGGSKEEYDAWQKSLREKKESLTDTLRPAMWNRVEVTITPAKPEELRYLELTMSTDRVSLRSAGP